MTAVEMHHSLQEKLLSFGYPAERLDSYFIGKLLNEALFVFIERYLPILKENEIARKKLHPLISNAEITPAVHADSNIDVNSITVTLPSDFYKSLNEYITTNSGVIDVKPIDYDEYNLNRLNPFKKPYGDLVWRLELNITAREHELIPDSGTTIVKYRLRYIRKPIEISIDSNNTCDLRVEDHEEIVNLALGIVAGNKTNNKKDE